MNAASRLAGFALALLLLFAGAAFAGSLIDAHPGKSTAKNVGGTGMAGMPAEPGGHGEKMAPQAVRGLAVSDNSLTLKLARTSARPGKPLQVDFRIVGRDGRTVRDFDVEHTKRMHFIVVRRDLTGFQHLHPARRADGSWSVPVTLRNAGSYRVFADFSVNGRPHTLADDVTSTGQSARGCCRRRSRR
jgi:hypothetical protein